MHPSVEILESRIAPAAVFTFTDVDGDVIQVKTSAALGDMEFNGKFTFDSNFLTKIDLTDDVFAKSDLKISVLEATGNGKAEIGVIDAAGNDLNTVKIAGDLSQILAGDINLATAGLKKLTATNFVFDPIGSPMIDALSEVQGALKTMAISENMSGVGMMADTLGKVTIGGNMSGGGEGIGLSASKIGSVTIMGSVLGGNTSTARIESLGKIGSIFVQGTLSGGNTDSASIVAQGAIGSIDLGGITGSGNGSAGIFSGASIDSINVRGNVAGGSNNSAVIAAQSVDSIRISGDLSGAADDTAKIAIVGALGTLKIGGDVSGGGSASATISAGKAEKIIIEGTLSGGAENSATIDIDASLGKLAVNGGVSGGGNFSSTIAVGGILKTASVLSLIGGGSGSSSISAEQIKFLTIAENISGGGPDSAIISATTLGSIIVGGNVTGSATFSGYISGQDKIGSVKIGGNLGSTSAPNTGFIASLAGSIGKVTIDGSILAGSGGNPAISAALGIKNLTVGTDVTGVSAANPVTILAGALFGSTTEPEVAFGKINIKGNVTNAAFLAGWTKSDGAVNGDAQISSVYVGGNWTASTLVAGTDRGTDSKFGTADDSLISLNEINALVSRIGILEIVGTVAGTADNTDHFGIVAEQIGKVIVGGTKLSLTPGASNDTVGIALGTDSDFFVREVLDTTA